MATLNLIVVKDFAKMFKSRLTPTSLTMRLLVASKAVNHLI